MLKFYTTSELRQKLKAEGLSHSNNTIIELEKAGIILKPAVIERNVRWYSEGEVNYILRIMRGLYKTSQRPNLAKFAKRLEELLNEQPISS